MKVILVSHAMTVQSTWSKSVLLSRKVDLETWIPDSWPGGYLREDNGGLIRPVGFRALRCRWAGRNHFHYYPGILKRLTETRPDILHIDEEPYSLATWQLVRAARRLGITPIFFTWQNIHKRYPWPFCAMEKFVLRHAAGMIGGNSASIEIFRRKGFDGTVAEIPQFGVDDELLNLQNNYRDSDRLRLVFAGRLVPEKGLLDVFPAVAARPWVTLDILGSGPHETELRGEVARLGVGDRVVFTGPAASTEVPARLAGYDALVLPSRTRSNWKEQFGRVLVEAMASGTPVIGSDSGEIPNVIGTGGLVFAEGDTEALGLLIDRLRSPQYRRELGAQGKAQAARFVQSRIAEQTLCFYRVIYEKHRVL